MSVSRKQVLILPIVETECHLLEVGGRCFAETFHLRFRLTVGCCRIGMVQIKIRNLQSQCFGVSIGAVGQHDDGQVVIGKTLDVCAEPNRLSIVREAFPPH